MIYARIHFSCYGTDCADTAIRGGLFGSIPRREFTDCAISSDQFNGGAGPSGTYGSNPFSLPCEVVDDVCPQSISNTISDTLTEPCQHSNALHHTFADPLADRNTDAALGTDGRYKVGERVVAYQWQL